MPVRPRMLEFDVTVDAAREAHSPLGGSTLPHEVEWWAEHLVLAGLVRCTLASMDYSSHRAGFRTKSSGRAHGRVTKRESDGLYAFVDIETTLEIDLSPAPETGAVRQLVVWAERGCFVSNSLTAKPRHHWIVNGEPVS
jgi:organic hydroperoxide reductase OsmC/OhrA